jgi:hypothetical protein
MVDSRLSADARVNTIVSSCNYHLRAFRYIRHSLNAELAESVGRAIIFFAAKLFQLVSGGYIIIEPRSSANHAKPMRENHKAMTTLARADMHWLPVRQRIEYKLSVLVCTIHSMGEPSYLADLLTNYALARCLRSSDDPSRVVVPATRTKLLSCSFRVAAPTQ